MMESGTDIRSAQAMARKPKRSLKASDERPDNEIWRIGDLANEFDLTLRTLRFYEDKGLLKPARKGNTRLYSRRDRARLKLIVTGRKIGFSVREIKQMIDLYQPQGSNAKQLKVALQKAMKQMERLQKQREAIDEAITELSHSIEIVREKLASGKEQIPD